MTSDQSLILNPADILKLLSDMMLGTMSAYFEFHKKEKIDDFLKAKMYRLFETYYQNVSLEQFNRDLDEKKYAILLWVGRDQDKTLIGFTTILEKTITTSQGKNVRCIFSGDTVVHHEYWGSKVLQNAFARYLLFTKLKSPWTPHYWMLMSKGYKTYLLMRRNFPQSYPANKQITPQSVQEVKDLFYQGKFKGFYNSGTSLIQFPYTSGAVKTGISEVPTASEDNGDTKFFLVKNPKHDRGVELACIAKMRLQDLVRIFTKYIFRYMTSSRITKSSATTTAAPVPPSYQQQEK